MPDEHEQTPPGVMVLAMGAQVLSKGGNPLREQGHLDLGPTGIASRGTESLDDFAFALLGDCHAGPEASKLRVRSTSSSIWAISEWAVSKRRSPRSRLRNWIRSRRP